MTTSYVWVFSRIAYGALVLSRFGAAPLIA